MINTEIARELIALFGLGEINEKDIIFKGKKVAHGLCFPIDTIMSQIHGVGGLLISHLWEEKTGIKQNPTIDITHAYLSPSAVFLIRSNGYPIYPWDLPYPTVGIYPTRDNRHIFINGGYPNLRDRILKVLDVPNDQQSIRDAISAWDALSLENALADAKACAAIVRDKAEWLSHPQGIALSNSPIIDVAKLNDTPAEPLNHDGDRPLSGIKVLDLSWVVAAPTCARFFAEHGAEVLHISAPHLPFIPPFVIETGNGKREAYLDLRTAEDLATLKRLLSEADILVEGWRPDIMKKYGLSPEEVQAIRPGIIHVTLSCYGKEGPFSKRAGWEQLGQAVSGIIASNLIEIDEQAVLAGSCAEHHEASKTTSHKKTKMVSDTLHTHGLLVCDYTTGILGALGALTALIKRSKQGGGYHINVSLARSGMWLMSKSVTVPTDNEIPLEQLPIVYKQHFLGSSQGPYGKLEFLLPVIQLDQTPPFFEFPSSPLGSSKPEWRS
jgi:hypothetical protein